MGSLPLNHLTVHKSSAIAHRFHAFLHSIATASFLFYRASSLFKNNQTITPPQLLIFGAELLLSFLWLLNQAYLWRPVSRSVFPERLPEDAELPAIDAFVCTADPKREPPLGVMNTVVSAMALDYPPEKLAVYLSDDGASPVTFYAAKEAWAFGKSWIPFCRKYRVKCRCPEAYFSSGAEEFYGGESLDTGFVKERENIKEKYDTFKNNLIRAEEQSSAEFVQTRPPIVKVIRNEGIEQEELPLFVYVSREKRPNHPHHFKAGALNVLIRVSALMSNAPCILMLDCDMYSNDPSSARQAMCFHLDPEISPSLAFVQFPQRFHNVSKKDIYGGEVRPVFTVKWPGMDGLDGPMLSGTCFYIKRGAFYGDVSGKDLLLLRNSFGPSNEFINTVHQGHRRHAIDSKDSQSSLQHDAELLASCTYEKQTEWGQKIGFLYHSLVEDFFTGFHLHCKGWTSVFCNPSRPAFLGSCTTNLNDSLVQGTRWSTGLVEVSLSRFCPLIYGPSKMSLLQRMCYAQLAFLPFICIPMWCFAVIPQLCLFYGIPLYPKVSSSWFLLCSFISVSSLMQHLREVVSTGGQIQMWWNEVRVWMIRALTSNSFGTLDVVLKWFGVREASFLPTNKVVDEEQIKQYQMGIYDFQISATLLAPIVTVIVLNIAAFVAGLVRMLIAGSCEELLGQALLSFFILLVFYPVIEGMMLRKDKGRVSPYVTQLSILFSFAILSGGSIVIR